MLGALAGGGLTAASLAAPVATSEAASNIGGVPTTPEVSAPELPGEASSPATATSTTTTPAPSTPSPTTTPSTGTTTTPQPQAPKQEAPSVVLQRRQKTTQGSKSNPKTSSATGKSKANGANNVEGSPQAVAKAGALAAVLASSQASTQSLAFYRVPLFMLPIYQAAAVQYGVPWQILAGINEIETDYGADQSVSSAGAVGWMQFMPETWSMYGVDALNAGYADPYNPVDAVFAAARYLRAAGAATDLRRAILAYNHSEEYVDSVMLRAKLISTYPKPVIATLTGLVDGRPPVGTGSLEWSAAHAEAEAPSASSATANAAAAKPKPSPATPGASAAVSPAAAAAAAAHAQPAPNPQVVNLTSAPNASVVAVQDGRVIKIGKNSKLGSFIVLRDVYGDVFTYAGLGSIARSYTRQKPSRASGNSSVVQVASSHDPAPSKAATAGTQAPVTLQVKTPAPQNHGAAGGRAEIASAEGVPAGMDRRRLSARPGNPDAKAAASASAARKAARAKAAQRLPLRAGSVVPSGTVLGKVWTGQGAHAGHMRFAIKPAGDSGYIDPGPVLANWAELQKALYPQGARSTDALLGATASDVFLLSRADLERTVLSDPGITINGCARGDVASGAIDKRVLAVLAFLSRSGLKPTVSALRCGQSQYTSAGVRSPHYRGDAVDISAINGVPLVHHQGPGTIADLTIRALLTLPAEFVPHEILSLMHYPASPQTKAVSSHWNQIELVFQPAAAHLQPAAAPASVAHSAAKGKAAPAPVVTTTVLSSLQWTQLVTRIGAIPAPKIGYKPSPSAIGDPKSK
ncbi:MAG TPA: lytic murein transglycosylase [Solirubrobacteraceae bacterium]|nr:lytic murein transglycosylase [Solirubrobacteraceae bacterium]